MLVFNLQQQPLLRASVRAHPLKGMEPELLSPEELMEPSLALRRSPGRPGVTPAHAASPAHRPPSSPQTPGWFSQMFRLQSERANAGGYPASDLHQPPYVRPYCISAYDIVQLLCVCCLAFYVQQRHQACHLHPFPTALHTPHMLLPCNLQQLQIHSLLGMPAFTVLPSRSVAVGSQSSHTFLAYMLA